MAVTSKWRQHIEVWQRSGLSQAEYCRQHQLNVRTFGARLSDYRQLPEAESAALIPVQVVPAKAEGICPRPSLGTAGFNASALASGAA